MCRVQTFCFSLTLRTGAIVASILSGIGVILTATLGVYFILLWHHVWEKHGKPSKYDLSPSLKETQKVLHGSGAICIGLAVINLVSVIFFTSGVIKNKAANLIIPWLVCIFFDIILLFLTIITLLSLGHWLVLTSLPLIAFMIYLWLVVLSYYQELKPDSKNRKLSYLFTRNNSTTSNANLQYHVIPTK